VALQIFSQMPDTTSRVRDYVLGQLHESYPSSDRAMLVTASELPVPRSRAPVRNDMLLTGGHAVRMIMFVAAKLEARKAPRCG